MRFDAYEATLPVGGVEWDGVAALLASEMGGQLRRGRPRQRYGEVLEVVDAGRCPVWVGRDRGNDLIHIEGKGETTPDLVQVVRRRFPEHSCTRADVAEDYRGGVPTFELLQSLVRQHKGPRVYGGYVAKPDQPEDGSTWVAGKRGGVSFMRLYEAGKKADRAHLNMPDLVRLELEVRPHYASDKRAAAAMSPVEFWGVSAWSKRVGEAVFAVDVPRFEVPPRAYDRDKTTLYVARTYRRHLVGMLEDYGDAECVFREFRAIWAEDDALQGKGANDA
jgi:hypothetical protein